MRQPLAVCMFTFLFSAIAFAKEEWDNYLESLVGKDVTIYPSAYPSYRMVYNNNTVTMRILNTASILQHKSQIGLAMRLNKEDGLYLLEIKPSFKGMTESLFVCRTSIAVIPCRPTDPQFPDRKWEIQRSSNGYSIKLRGTGQCMQRATTEGHIHTRDCSSSADEQKFDFFLPKNDPVYKEMHPEQGHPFGHGGSGYKKGVDEVLNGEADYFPSHQGPGGHVPQFPWIAPYDIRNHSDRSSTLSYNEFEKNLAEIKSAVNSLKEKERTHEEDTSSYYKDYSSKRKRKRGFGDEGRRRRRRDDDDDDDRQSSTEYLEKYAIRCKLSDGCKD